MRIVNTSKNRTPSKGLWSGIAVEGKQTIEVENEEYAKEFMRVYPWIKRVVDWDEVLKKKSVRDEKAVQETIAELPADEIVPKKVIKEMAKEKLEIGVVISERVRSPDYIRDREKEMKKYVPILRVGRLFGVYLHKPFIRKLWD